MPKYVITATFVSEGEVTIEAEDFDAAVAIATDLSSGDFEFLNGTEMNVDSVVLLEKEVV